MDFRPVRSIGSFSHRWRSVCDSTRTTRRRPSATRLNHYSGGTGNLPSHLWRHALLPSARYFGLEDSVTVRSAWTPATTASGTSSSHFQSARFTRAWFPKNAPTVAGKSESIGSHHSDWREVLLAGNAANLFPVQRSTSTGTSLGGSKVMR